MFSKILGFFFDTALGKGTAIFIGLAALWGSWQLDRAQQRNLGAQHAKTEINEKAGELVDKARAARDAVDDATALDRLRQRYCRDC